MSYTIGWGWRKTSESLKKALKLYESPGHLDESLEIAKRDFQSAVENKFVSKTTKPIFFKVLVQDVKEEQ